MEIFENYLSPCCSDADMIMPYPPMNGMPCPYPMPGPMPMPYPPTNGMPCPYPMPEPMPMPYPPMNGMPCPHPMPMPPMPIEDCDEEMLHHMEQMYCMHMYMAALNKTEAYKHKMMQCYCKHHMNDH